VRFQPGLSPAHYAPLHDYRFVVLLVLVWVTAGLRVQMPRA